MAEVETIIEQQLIEFRKKFRPAFGNPEHIEIIRQSEVIAKLEKELAKKVEASEGAKRLKDEIKRAKRNLLFTFKKQ